MADIRFRQLMAAIGSVGIALLNAACAAPGALQITPCEITLGRGQTATVRVVDADSVTPPHVAWRSANPAIAEIIAEGENDEVTIRAHAPGRTCIDATYLLEFAKTCVTVLETASVPAGRARWIVAGAAVLPSAQIADVVPARHDRMPLPIAMFVVEADWGIARGHRDQRVTVRGLDADGQERWRQHIEGVVYQTSVSDGYGVTAEGDVVRLDVTTGRKLGAAIRVSEGARVLAARPEGGVVVRDVGGHVRHYDLAGTLLKTVQTPSDGQHPWRLQVIGKDFIETEGANVFAFR